jgi:succinylglutamic semialdehyde dehydrogenase
MSANFSSLSPIDEKPVWQGHETQNDEIEKIMHRASLAGQTWQMTTLEQRIQVVRNYQSRLEADRAEIEALIVREVGKLPWEVAGEVGASIAKIDLSVQAYQQRRSDQTGDPTASNDSPVQRKIRYRPLGVTVVLGPFNFPLHLPGGQIIPALLAGNAVVFKPSEQATAVGQWIVDAWRSAGLDEDLLQPIFGGPSVAGRAIDSRHTAAVFLTGSRAAGRAIHRQLAGRPDVLLALELGGNNPIVIAEDVAVDTVAAIVSASAFISAGQRCTCARRAIFVESASTTSQIERLVKRTQDLRVGMPTDSPQPHVGPLISKSAADGLRTTYEKLLQLGCRPVIPFETDSHAANLVRPTIVDASGFSAEQLAELGQLEWFGPLLVIQTVPNFDTAVASAANTSYGLAAALLGGDQRMFDRFAIQVGAGVVNWNGTTTGAAGTLPFGGLGDSGNHRPAGFFAIDFCNDPIAILERSSPPSDDPWNAVK